MISIWDKVAVHWPVYVGAGQVSFTTIRQEMENFLIVHEVFPQDFSHYGLVVRNIKTSLETLDETGEMISNEPKTDWVETYAVYVRRSMLGSKELEFVQPSGDSFFDRFLKENGEGLHHLAFVVSNIQSCLKKLKDDNVELIDKKPRFGSHGKVAFLSPGLFGRICIELCQEYNK